MQKQDKNNYIKKTKIPGLLVFERPTFTDERGFFREPVRLNEIEEAIGTKFRFKQWNHSCSHSKVIRGIHAENWNKVIYPITGHVFLALVDVRPQSRTFGKFEIFDFDAENEHKAFYIPKGVANSICVVGNRDVNYLYLVDAYYDGKDTTAIAWNDPDLKVPWPIKNPIVSQRDMANPRLRDLYPKKFSK